MDAEPTMAATAVPSCYLYTLAPSQRIRNELLEIGIDIDNDNDTTIDVETLNQVDGMRYEASQGTEMFRTHLDEEFGQDTVVTVLDVGSGFGGPSRLLALTRPGTKLVALELVPEISDLARALTERTQVSDSVTHVTGDVCSSLSTSQRFHSAQAVLTLLHVPDIHQALSSVCQQLQPNGTMYIEDFCTESGGMSEKSLGYLKDIIGCPRGAPMTREAWIACLQEAGFHGDVEFQEVTDAWQPWVHERSLAYAKDMNRHVRVQGKEIAKRMLEFYETMDTLFSTELRGCRILAKKQ